MLWEELISYSICRGHILNLSYFEDDSSPNGMDFQVDATPNLFIRGKWLWFCSHLELLSVGMCICIVPRRMIGVY